MSKIELMFLIIFLGNVEKSVSFTSNDDDSRNAVKIGEHRRKSREKNEKWIYILNL